MPTVYDGIGTWYYGKDNLFLRRGVCPYCGREGELSSFDTTKYFVVVFIPLIPLGKSRVLDKCPHCTKHAVIPLKQWRQQRQEAIDKAVAAVQARPDDPQAHLEAMDTFITFQDRDLCLQYASLAQERCPENAEVLTQAGRMFVYFGRFEEANEALAAALAVEETDDRHELLAITLIKAGRPDDASEHLLHIVENSITDKVGTLILHAKSFQAHGEHDKALEVFDEAVRISPELAQNKEYKKLRKLSQKNLASGKAIKSKDLSALAQTRQGRGIRRQAAKIVGPVVLAALLAIYLGVAWNKGQHRKVYLINGLNHVYSVNIADQTLALTPHVPTPVELAEGDIRLVVNNCPVIESPQTLTITTNFFARPFINRTFIINLDAVEVLVREKVYYAVEYASAPDPTFELLTGKTLHTLKHIDYIFTTFPKELDLPDGRPLSKDRITTVNRTDAPVSYENMPYNLLQNNDIEDVRRYLELQVRYQQAPDDWMELFFMLTEPVQACELARPYLAARPVRMDWHRTYQATREKIEPDYDLAKEYQSYLDTDPDNTDLCYLLARVTADKEQACALYLRSLQEPHPCPYGYNGLAYIHQCNGEFEEALNKYRQARTMDPNNPTFENNYYQMLLATENLQEARHYCRERLAQEGNSLSWLLQDVVLTERIEGPGSSQPMLTERLTSMEPMTDEDRELVKVWQKGLKTYLAYLHQDLPAYRQNLDQNSPNDQFWLALTDGKIPDAQLYQDSKNPYQYLLVYLVAARCGEENPDRFYDKALELLKSQGREERQLAQCLTPASPRPEDVCGATIDTNAKAILLTALGVKYPQHRRQYHALASRLNYHRQPPYWLLKSFHEEG